MPGRRTITLLTDYGTGGPFAGALRGAILKANPEANVVDITHQVAPGNILEAAFILSCAYPFYPEGTIHVAVVDPTVGSDRRGLLVSTENHYFIGPDNGIFSYVFAREEVYNVFELTEDHFFLKPLSNTFHGRDIFAPVAGFLSKGVETGRLGTLTEQWLTLSIPLPAEVRSKAWKGSILHADAFGNLITNFTPDQIPLDENGYPAIVKILTTRGEVKQVRKYFSEFPDREPFLLLGSAGYYEIAINGDSAAAALNLKAGSEIGVLLK